MTHVKHVNDSSGIEVGRGEEAAAPVSRLEDPTDTRACRASVHGATKSRTRLSD